MGCSHDEMADILKGLGYGSKPKPQEEPQSPEEPTDDTANKNNADEVALETADESNIQTVKQLWYPKKRPTHKAKPRQKTQNNKSAGKKAGHQTGNGHRKSTSNKNANKNYEKKVDPNSPFAVLQSLKDNK